MTPSKARLRPPRLVLGPDAYGYIKTALTARLEQLEAYKDITMATDCDGDGAR